jgi:hypothetical protein
VVNRCALQKISNLTRNTATAAPQAARVRRAAVWDRIAAQTRPRAVSRTDADSSAGDRRPGSRLAVAQHRLHPTGTEHGAIKYHECGCGDPTVPMPGARTGAGPARIE